MQFYSTNNKSLKVSLKEAVQKSLASDNGLYMPEKQPILSSEFFKKLPSLSLQEIGLEVANAYFGEDINHDALKRIVNETLNFDIPLVKVEENIYSLELFHGPTAAFKDVGARFMARTLAYFSNRNEGDISVLVATSGDTGGAVANGFYNVPGVNVTVLYPRGLVSEIQEKQFTTLGNNITALEIDGTFDDCQALVKQAFLDKELNNKFTLTSANSINLARLLPQSFYYFYALKQLGEKATDVVFSIPSGNFGNLTAGIFAKRSGLPIKRFIAATNINHIIPDYLRTQRYEPRPSIATIANAMDVGNPNNFTRILDLYNGDHSKIVTDIEGFWCDDNTIREVLSECYQRTGYLMDTHGTIGYQALREKMQPGETGIFFETAHPAKFKETVESIIKKEVFIPEQIQAFMSGKKQSISMSKSFPDFKSYMLSR